MNYICWSYTPIWKEQSKEQRGEYYNRMLSHWTVFSQTRNVKVHTVTCAAKLEWSTHNIKPIVSKSVWSITNVQ